ncbi:alkylation response protein AidB-like acyl-CoA dehydrogenase [Williamsia limnetica]|uniref:Alkylation response protein AidB-like acyl-CoA dehydrogenase n=2 Tax=Williamsia limnetica TaxID=882452 RepID=A0A318RBG9_WILLI|nr:alkylation response protein AidB-like acyl-CoA dehydrogenase [Williamsia limnetica]
MGEAATRLRGQLRELLRARIPADFRGAFTDDPVDLDIAQRFCRYLAAQGLLCLAWPEEFGGRDASVWEQTVVREEMWAHHEPRGAQYMGVNWVGPTIMRHGTSEQQRDHLPPISRGEVIWCQGFSEPGSGSDLASLRTAARRSGDGWRISGQKIWTSYATMAQWCFLLARTSTGDRKQQGLTVFLVPMSDPAIEVRPIRAMLGPHHLNEVFFNDLEVTQAHVLGTVGEGWKVVQEVLAFERVGIARYARCERLLQTAPGVLGDDWDDLPAELRGRWTRMLVHCRRARLLAYRVVAMQSEGRVQPSDAALYRIAVTTLDQHSAEVLTEIASYATSSNEDAERFRLDVRDHWNYSQAATVASGSIEMQRILLARTLLPAAS